MRLRVSGKIHRANQTFLNISKYPNLREFRENVILYWRRLNNGDTCIEEEILFGVRFLLKIL
ncbi:hypothetical protein [Bacillus sp. B-jedd]|uniref:hypothetical protein n=1 Tax=Bacillus sp. B-jedd TaxID=1476857 RepID=UPI0011DCAE41|nr:hypothetical protein [Bacillus sp. B-jedd]